MKSKIIFLHILFISIIVLFSQLYCGSGNGSVKHENLLKKEGWINNNIYRIRGEGKPEASLKSSERKKISSKKAALFNAKFKLRHILMQQISKKKSKLIKNIIDKGKIIYDNYDPEGNCKIIYEINYLGLKNIIKK